MQEYKYASLGNTLDMEQLDQVAGGFLLRIRNFLFGLHSNLPTERGLFHSDRSCFSSERQQELIKLKDDFGNWVAKHPSSEGNYREEQAITFKADQAADLLLTVLTKNPSETSGENKDYVENFVDKPAIALKFQKDVHILNIL